MLAKGEGAGNMHGRKMGEVMGKWVVAGGRVGCREGLAAWIGEKWGK